MSHQNYFNQFFFYSIYDSIIVEYYFTNIRLVEFGNNSSGKRKFCQPYDRVYNFLNKNWSV